MIIMLQSTDLEKPSNKEGSTGWVSQGRRNRIDFAGGLGLKKMQWMVFSKGEESRLQSFKVTLNRNSVLF